MRTMKATILIGMILALMVSAPAAIAQDPARKGYDETTILQSIDPGPSIADESDSTADGSAGGNAGGTLPFTGLDVGILALMGLALVGTGAVMRRGVRNSA